MNMEMDNERRFLTTTQEAFSMKFADEEKKKASNKFAKYHSLKLSGKFALNYDKSTLENSSSTSTDIVQPVNSNNSFRMTRSNSKFLRTADAPVAVGRSGIRKEKGLTASGLAGERLMNEPDAKKDTLVQRSWLYQDDPAVRYKINGIPKLGNIEGMSLPIGNENEDGRGVNWNHGRKAILTGDVLSRSRTKFDANHIFLDDKP